MNALDEYFMEKDAFWGALGKAADRAAPTMGDIAKNTAVQFGVAAGMAAAAPVAAKVYNAVTKRHSYNQMLEQNPDLADARAEDPKQFNNMYNSFHRLNPEFARDPTVSGTYMRQMVAHPEGAGKVIVESLRGREGMGRPFGDVMRAGQQAGQKAFSGTFSEQLKPQPEPDPFGPQKQRVEQLGLQIKEHELGQKQRHIEEAQRQQRLF